MFEGFARVWTPVALAEELSSGATLAVEVSGTPVVLFRDAQGRAVGLVDRFPHRSPTPPLRCRPIEGCRAR